jgi:hypothetical protein
VRTDEILTAFVELEAAVRAVGRQFREREAHRVASLPGGGRVGFGTGGLRKQSFFYTGLARVGDVCERLIGAGLCVTALAGVG